MHPSYSHHHPYWSNFQPQPTIENYRWENVSVRGWRQSQFIYHGPTPHFDPGFQNVGGRHLPQQTAGPSNPVVAPEGRPLPKATCEVCGVNLISSDKSIEQHTNGKRHRRMLRLHGKSVKQKAINRQESEEMPTSLMNSEVQPQTSKLHEESEKQKAINRQESEQTPTSLSNSEVQPQTVKKCKRNGCLVENMSSESTVEKHKDYLMKNTGETSKVSGEKPQGEPSDINRQESGKKLTSILKSKVQPDTVKKSKRNGCLVEKVSSESTVDNVMSKIENYRWVRGWSQSQSQFIYHGPTPHFDPGFQNVGGRYLPQQTAGPSNPVVAPERRPLPRATCEVCGVKLSSSDKSIEQHINGKRHRRMLRLHQKSEKQKAINRQESGETPTSQMNLDVQPQTSKLHEEPEKRKAINRQESGQTPTSLSNLEVQPQTVKKCKRNGCLVEKMSSESTVEKHKDYLMKNTGETSKVSGEKPQGEPSDINRQESGKKPTSILKLEVQPDTVKKSKRNGCLVEKVSSESTVDKHRDYLKKNTGETSKVPAEKPQGEPRDINRQESGKTPTSLLNSEVQPHTVKNLKRNGCLVEKVSSESTVDKCKDYLKKNTGETSKVSAEKPQGEPRDINRLESGKKPTSLLNSEVQPHTVKKLKRNGCLVENVSSESTVDKRRDYLKKNMGETSKVPAEKRQGEPRDINRLESGKMLNSLMNSEVQPQTSKLHEESKKQKAINRQESGHSPNSLMNSEVQPQTVKDYLKKDTGETSKVPAEKPQGEPRDNFVALTQGHGFKCKIRGSRGDEYKRKRRATESSKPDVNALSNCVESIVQEPAVAPPEGPSALQEFSTVPAVESSFEPQFQLVLQPELEPQMSEAIPHYESLNPTDRVNIQLRSSVTVEFDAPAGYSTNTETADGSFKAEEKVDVLPTEKGTAPLSQVLLSCCENRGSGGDEYKKKKKRKRRATELSKPDISAFSNCAESLVQEPAVEPPEGPSALQEFSPVAAVGSSFEPEIQLDLQPELESQVLETIAHYESLSPTDQANVQLPSSIAVECDASAGSGTNTETADGSFKAEEKMDVLTTEKRTAPLSQVSLSCCEISRSGGDEYKKKRKRKRRATESLKPDANASSNCVESLVQEPAGAPPEGPSALQELSPVPAVGLSFETQIQLVLQPELEHQVSETIGHSDNINPTDQAKVQLPPSVTVEFDAPEGSSTNTETADGSFKAEEKMDVLITEERTALLSQVNVCLKCGSQGFQETLVFCNKCHTYALHRYCLDGPVIFIEDVTWFCEDCEPAVVERINNDKTSITLVEENKQQQQNILSKTKDQLYDSHSTSHHGLSQCNNECDREKKFKKVCQVVLKDAANSSEETVTDKNSQAALKDASNSSEETVTGKNSQEATSDGPNFVELEADVVAEPIMDPTWRGSFCLHNQSTGTVCGLLAHLSSLACCQVMEKTRLLPEDLSVELLQRSAVWPNYFKKCGPNHDSIALYFFPENERAERGFDKLVDDIIHFDQAMRVVLEQAELLVFPSTLLPIQYWRFQAKYYLWGVFRATRTSSNTSGVVCV